MVCYPAFPLVSHLSERISSFWFDVYPVNGMESLVGVSREEANGILDTTLEGLTDPVEVLDRIL